MSEKEKVNMDAVSDWLEQLAKSKGWQYVDYSQEKDFEHLWKNDSKASLLLIDWNGFPPEHSLFPKIVEFITPLDWALAVAYDRVEANPHAPNLPQVVIVDRCSHRYPGSFAVEMRRAMADALPHVKIFSALGNDSEDALAFVQFLQSDSTEPAQKPRIGQMRALRQAWIGYTVQSGDHHDLSNLLGPLVLSRGFNESSLPNGLFKDKLVRALLQKIIWSGLDGGRGDPQGKWFDFSRDAAKIVCKKERVKIILIDDQANQGWLDIVSAAVGAVRPNADQASGEKIERFAESDVVEVFACTSYDAIMSHIETMVANGDQRFKFNLTKENGSEILLLDLRLFFDEKKEIDYFNWALGVAKKLKCANFPDTYCDKLRTWIDKPKESKSAEWRRETEYFELLTLLPRILATIDMSLPIVIFSSTGQRQVTEALKSYGNIITVFEKPRFFGYASEDIVKETRDKFSQALDKAVKMLYARKVCLDLIEVSVNTAQSIEGGKHNHIEIFIDEDHPEDNDQTNIFIGGCVAIYVGDDKIDAQKKADQFDEDMVSAGARYFDCLDIGKKSPRIKPKKASLAGELEKALLGENKPIYLGVVRLLRQRIINDGLAGDMTADNHYRHTLSMLLELFLCEVLPQLFQNGCTKDNTSTSIYVGTRVKYHNEFMRSAFEEAKSRFGLSGFRSQEGNRDAYYLTSMDRGGVFPIIADLQEFRNVRTEIERAIGIMLCYHTPLKKRTYPLNFICRTCKEVVSYIADNLIATAVIDGEGGQPFQNIAEVKGMPTDRDFGFIRPIGASEDSKFFKRNCTDFDHIKIGKLVTYERIEANVRARGNSTAIGVRLANEETSKAIKASMKKILPRVPTCGVCVEPDFVPDYRALHYLADEVLDKFPSKDKSPYGKLEIIFDDNLDNQLETLVEAGRALDSGDVVSAVIKASQALASDKPIGKAGRYILARIPNVLKRMSSQDYWRLSLSSVLPLGDNELRIKFKGTVGEDGVSYAVLALSNGNACAVLSMANPQVAECEIGQIVVVKSMNSNRHAKVSHSAYKLCVLDFVGLGSSGI
jgi:hypothetical protein